MIIKKFSLIMSGKGKRFLMVVSAIILLTIIINSAIFANIGSNPLVSKYIIIDPGHGGVDPGTNDNYSFFEKDINLSISRKLRDVLEVNRTYVALTRVADIALDDRNNLSTSRQQRDLLARVSEFNSGKFEIFLSIHVNRSANTRAAGPYVFYSPKLPQSAFLAHCLQNRLNQHTRTASGGKIARKPMQANYFILKNSNIPGVLIETGFISNVEDKKLLQTEDYQTKLSESICAGLKDYFKNVNNLKEGEYQEGSPDSDSIEQDEGVPFNIVDEVKLVAR